LALVKAINIIQNCDMFSNLDRLQNRSKYTYCNGAYK